MTFIASLKHSTDIPRAARAFLKVHATVDIGHNKLLDDGYISDFIRMDSRRIWTCRPYHIRIVENTKYQHESDQVQLYTFFWRSMTGMAWTNLMMMKCFDIQLFRMCVLVAYTFLYVAARIMPSFFVVVRSSSFLKIGVAYSSSWSFSHQRERKKKDHMLSTFYHMRRGNKTIHFRFDITKRQMAESSHNTMIHYSSHSL